MYTNHIDTIRSIGGAQKNVCDLLATAVHGEVKEKASFHFMVASDKALLKNGLEDGIFNNQISSEQLKILWLITNLTNTELRRFFLLIESLNPDFADDELTQHEFLFLRS